MASSAARLLTLIMLLQAKPRQKAGDLAAELGVSVRTLHRDFSRLEEIGIPIYAERGRHGGFSLVRGYKLPPLMLDPQEAAAIYLGTNLVEQLWGDLYRLAARGALAKLENLLPDEQRREVDWARRSLAVSGMHRAAPEPLAPWLAAIRSALRQGHTLQLCYGAGGGETRRIIEPYVLLYRWGWWYLVAFCRLRRALRTFRVDRILALEPGDETCTIPDDFDLNRYLQEAPLDERRIRARLRFPAASARAAHESRSYWESLEEHADGSVTVSLEAPSLEWAASSVLAYGPIVEVLEPQALQRLVGTWAKAIAARYPGREGEADAGI